MILTQDDIARLRMLNQDLTLLKNGPVSDLVAGLGAMQAQDLDMVKWAIGMRMKEASLERINRAINEAEIIRTHLMRPTWHIVSPDDIYWMLELTAPRIRSSIRHRQKHLGLSQKFLVDCYAVIKESLAGKKAMTKEQLVNALEANKLDTKGDNKAAHILMSAELEGLICSGPVKSRNITYALLTERVPARGDFDRDKALKKMAEGYFKSHGPATLEDFKWWSGLLASEVREGIAMLGKDFFSARINDREYFFKETAINMTGVEGDRAYLIPAFDEIIISYRDRSAMLSSKDMKSAISSNGIFRPVIIIGGKVCGLWNRKKKNDHISIEVRPLRKLKKSEEKAIRLAAKEYGAFLMQEAEIMFVG